MNNYTAFDRPEILMFLFHPRRETELSAEGGYIELSIPVENEIVIGSRFYSASKDAPVLLFFHGNGEIVDDYSDIGPIFTRLGLNFFPVDYRGYGTSTGRPTVSSMMSDSHKTFEFAQKWLKDNGFSGKIILYGRSLGSAPVLELVSAYPDAVAGLIVESGFALIVPLMRLLGINAEVYNISESSGFQNLEKIQKFSGPTLIIHAEFDHIIPYNDGQALFKASPDPGKMFLKIPGANHNNIFMCGMREYMDAIKNLAERVK